jgi:dienelactone hydrolase
LRCLLDKGEFKVRLHLFLMMAATLLAPGMAQGAGAERTETVSFASGSYADFGEVFMRPAPPAAVTLSATLRFPEEEKERYAAVVIVHTIVGYQEANEGWHAEQFRKAGFATLTYDSFAARGLSEAEIIAAPRGPPFASAVADAYAALQALAGHPKIDGRRVAIVGFSFGGEVAHLTAFERLRARLVQGQLRYAAHIAYYPAGVYGAAAASGAYTGAPVLMLLGDKDDNLPTAKLAGYLAYARDAGYPPPVETLIYPGAYHAWTVPGLGAARFYPQYGSTRHCPFILLAAMGPMLLVEGRESSFDPTAFRACVDDGRGYSMGYDAAVRDRSTDDALAFLRKHLGP